MEANEKKQTTGLVLSEQVRQLYKHQLGITLLPMVAVGILATVFWGVVPAQNIIAWIALTVFFISGVGLWLRWHYAKQSGTESPEYWLKLFISFSVSSGLSWGVGALFLFPEQNISYQMVLLMFMYSGAAFPAVTMAAHRPTFIVAAGCMLAPVALRLAMEGERIHLILSATTPIYFFMLVYFHTQVHNGLIESIRLWFEKNALAVDLDIKRREAEQAHREKSLFLAAASHDLRQPVRAQELLFHELRQRLAPGTEEHLMDQLGMTVHALNHLLDTLTDVAQLDDGALQPKIEPVPVQSILSQVEAEFALTASAKGLDLRIRKSDVVLQSDPDLLARVVQNLVNNALQYTAEGSVLVGCRNRGESVEIQVIDTGMGIDESERTTIFAAYQRGSASDQSGMRGMGLGLSIVSRLCELLGHTVHVDSKLGSGSLFGITVPKATLPPR